MKVDRPNQAAGANRCPDVTFSFEMTRTLSTAVQLGPGSDRSALFC